MTILSSHVFSRIEIIVDKRSELYANLQIAINLSPIQFLFISSRSGVKSELDHFTWFSEDIIFIHCYPVVKKTLAK